MTANLKTLPFSDRKIAVWGRKAVSQKTNAQNNGVTEDRERNMGIQSGKHSGHTEYDGGGVPVLAPAAELSAGKPVRRSKAGSLEQALADALLENGEQEFDCMLLFEFPATMLGDALQKPGAKDGMRAAACLCQLGSKAQLIFITTSADGHSVRLYEENEVTRELAELSWSYARILSFMPATLACEQHPAIN